MDHQFNAAHSTSGTDARSEYHPVSSPDTYNSFQSASIATFPVSSSGIAHLQPQFHQELQGAPPNMRAGFSSSKQAFFLTGAPERKFGAEPIYSTYPLPPFVSPEKLGAPPTSPTTTAFGQSPTSMIDSRGSFGAQIDVILAMASARQEHEDALTKQLWEQYDALAAASQNSEHDSSAPKSTKRDA